MFVQVCMYVYVCMLRRQMRFGLEREGGKGSGVGIGIGNGSNWSGIVS